MQRNALSRSSLRRSGTPASGGGGGGGDCCADWNLSIGRYFFVDPVNGNDSNEGWIDAALGSTFTPANVAVVAIRTHARLREVLPAVGNNRTAIVFYGAAVYGESMDWRGVGGYRQLLRRGSTDFTNSVSDRITAGFVTALAGLNGDGSFTVAAGSTVDLINISAGAFTAEPGILGFRIRFTGNVTAALANVSQPIYSNTGTSLVPEASIGTAPAVGDTFFIERPGVVFNSYYPVDSVSSSSNNLLTVNGAWPVVGIRVDSTVASSCIYGTKGRHAETMAGFEQTSSTSAISVNQSVLGGLVNVGVNYADEVNVTRAIGFGLRVEDQFQGQNPLSVLIPSFYGWNSAGGTHSFASPRAQIATTSGYIANGFGSTTNPFGPGTTSAQGGVARSLGPLNPTTRPLRIVSPGSSAGIFINSSNWLLRSIAITNAGALPGIRLDGPCKVVLQNVTGLTGNTDVGIDSTRALNSDIRVDDSLGTNSLSGTLGDMRITGPAITTYAGLALTNIVDNQRNNIVGAAGQVVDVCKLVVNDNGSALQVGQVVRGNGTTNEVESAVASSSAAAHVSGVMVTPPANGANGYMVCAGTPYVLFDAAPTPGAIAYLDDGTTGTLSTTAPANALQVGRVISGSGSTGRVTWHPQNAIQSGAAAEPEIVLHEAFLSSDNDAPLRLRHVAEAGGSFYFAPDTADTLHQGIANLVMAATGWNGVRSTISRTPFAIPPAASASWSHKWVFKTPTNLSDVTNRYRLIFGMGNDIPDYLTRQVVVRYSDNINGGNFQLRCTDSGGTTDTDAVVTVAADTWYFLEIVFTRETVSVYIDTVYGSRTLRATGVANIPTDGLTPIGGIRIDTYVADRNVLIDDWRAEFTRV